MMPLRDANAGVIARVTGCPQRLDYCVNYRNLRMNIACTLLATGDCSATALPEQSGLYPAV